jgi:hypothetical protein
MRLAVAAVGALAVAATACGGVAGEPGVEQAAERTEALASYAYELRSRSRVVELTFDRRCEGVVDNVSLRSRLACADDHETVVDDDTVYIRGGARESWWKLAEFDGAFEQVSYETVLRPLRSDVVRTERVGEEDVGDVSTVHYAVTVECGAGPLDCSDGTGAVDVWIDADELVRRVRYDSAALTTTIEFFDFGVPVVVEPPPASEVENVG